MKKQFGISGLVVGFLLAVSFSAYAETFTANISSAQEVPVNASTATGFGRVFLNETAGTITFTVTFSGLSGDQTAAHIHGPAGIGANGAVIINLGLVGGTSGTLSGTVAITPTQITSMRAHQTYINIHSTTRPGGEIRGQLAAKRPLDYDADGKTDYSVLRFPNVAPPGVAQITYWNRNSQGPASNQTVNFGNANTDFPAPGDYDGDAKDDMALYRAGATPGAQSFFIILRSSDFTAQWLPWGVNGDRTVARDYDGDGKTDLAIFRNGATATSQTTWWISQSSDGAWRIVGFGLTGNGSTTFDTPIPGDYDGDGKFDIAVYRFGQSPSNTYFVLHSAPGSSFSQIPWGDFSTDYIVPGDYDGDGKFEVAAVRTGATSTTPMFWWIRNSSNSAVRVVQFGISSDRPTQGDYDGDGVTDISVWRANADGANNRNFYTLGSFNGSFLVNGWGMNGDFPVNNFDVR